MNTAAQPPEGANKAPPAETKTRVELAREYYEQGRWTSLWTLKKKAKYSWQELGFTDKEATRIKLKKPDFI